MRASHELSRVEVSFDDPNLVSHGGLLQAASLWQRLGMPGVVRRGLRLPGSVGANSDAKVATVVLGMLAGADSIDDLGVLRAGATGRLLGAAKAPSTIGTWLRSFTYGHLRQLDAIARQLLLVCWTAGAGPHRLDELLHLDLDSTIVETHGLAKEGAFFGYTGVRGHHPLIARVSEPGQPGWIAHTRFRRGNAAAGRGGAHFLAETIARVRSAGSTGALLVRADSGFYDSRFIAACRRAGAAFSVTARIDTAVARAIASIGDDAWQPIPYWDAVEDDDGIIVASSAEVAETVYTAFTSTKQPVTARLVVRRVRRLREAATGEPLDQQALPVPVWRHHAVLTDRIEPLLDVEREHRAHAVVEQSIAELKQGPLAHLPSGDFWANAAWLTLAAMTINMGRAIATLAGHGLGEATLATLQRTLLAVPARLARSARRYHLHLPVGWPWQTALTWLKRRIDALPLIT
jgi:hypothetical protein